jgi:hypothetical protein
MGWWASRERRVSAKLGPLLEEWIATQNRNAHADRSRFGIRVRPRWADVKAADVKAEADLIAQHQRLVHRLAEPTGCK